MAQARQVTIAQLAEVDAEASERLRTLRRPPIFIPRPSDVVGSALAGLVGEASAYRLAGRFPGSILLKV